MNIQTTFTNQSESIFGVSSVLNNEDDKEEQSIFPSQGTYRLVGETIQPQAKMNEKTENKHPKWMCAVFATGIWKERLAQVGSQTKGF